MELEIGNGGTRNPWRGVGGMGIDENWSQLFSQATAASSVEKEKIALENAIVLLDKEFLFQISGFIPLIFPIPSPFQSPRGQYLTINSYNS
ncbi:MAG TPA: hypothetical protein V6C91_04085 [Coleofasciculaceae cyanobacterium]